ncbi:glycosyltransferase family 2 protein [Haliovirga abyssi]|uniref:Glycosyl transferase n=1 Tax=Haliovirga abyssi TaxID=2996794 RepID=A0AAU9D612_9FUSO|nr:hypothetical protein [Haliovirga abyssi]BDU51409.1 glycosyl transferase [Haliovirga abyssi]
MKIGVVLLNYNSSEDILKLVEELYNIEEIFIVILDNSEKMDGNLLKLEEKNRDKIKYIFNNMNLGYYKGNLVGVKYLFNNHNINNILILNPDVGSNAWNKIIEKLLCYFKTEKDFIVGPKIKIPGYKDVSSPKPKFSFYKEIIYNFLFPISYIFLRKKQTKLAKKSGKVFTVEGSAYMVDAKKYISLENYFNNIFLYGEELIFGLIAEKNKWDIYFDNSINVLHYHPPRKESKTYDKYYIESLKEICNLFKISKMLENILIFSVYYKNYIKKLILKIKR